MAKPERERDHINLIAEAIRRARARVFGQGGDVFTRPDALLVQRLVGADAKDHWLFHKLLNQLESNAAKTGKAHVSGACEAIGAFSEAQWRRAKESERGLPLWLGAAAHKGPLQAPEVIRKTRRAWEKALKGEARAVEVAVPLQGREVPVRVTFDVGHRWGAADVWISTLVERKQGQRWEPFFSTTGATRFDADVQLLKPSTSGAVVIQLGKAIQVARDARDIETERELSNLTIRRWGVRFVFMLVTAGIFATVGVAAFAAYRAERMRLLRMFTQWSISGSGICDETHGNRPVALVSFTADAATPLIVLRDDEYVATVYPDKKGSYEFSDRDVVEGHSYVYRFGKKPWGIGAPIMSVPQAVMIPPCRKAGNRPPIVGEIHSSVSPVRVGDPIEFSVDASDPDGDPLSFYWFLLPKGESFRGPRCTTRYDTPGRYDLNVTVSDGAEPNGFRSAWIGVSAMNPRNHPPSITKFMIAPTTVRPGEPIKFVAVAHDADRDPLQYEWNWDQEVWTPERTNRTQQMKYEKPGIYHPHLTVIDTSLATTEATATVTVTPDAPLPRLRCAETQMQVFPNLYPDVHVPVRFELALQPGSPVITSVLWDFGDGSPLRETRSITTDYRFQTAGVYSVSALVHAGKDAAICSGFIVAGHPPLPPQASRPVVGQISPERGDTHTVFHFTAMPPESGPAPAGSFRWSFRHHVGGFLLETAWQGTPRYAQRFDRDGLYDVSYEYRRPDGKGAIVFSVGDLFVEPSKQDNAIRR